MKQKLRTITDLILRPVSSQPTFFTFLLLLSGLVIPTLCYATDAFPKTFVWATPIFCCYLFAVLAYCLRPMRLQWVVWIVGFLLFGGEVFSLLCYQSPYSMTVLQLLLETNQREAAEFLGGHGVAGQMATSTAITLASLLVAWFVVKVCKRLEEIPQQVGRTILTLLIVLSSGSQCYSYFRICQTYRATVTTTVSENKYMPLRNSPLVRFLYGHALNVVSTKELSQLVHTIRATEVDSCSHRSPIIIMLLGESYNKHHSPLYNPEARQTTPGLCQLQQSGNLIVCDDAIAPYNVTTKTLRHMFSTYYPECGRDWVDCTLFPAVFRQAGYRVWFLTNQFAGEANNKDHHGHAGGTIFNQSELRQLQFTHMNSEATRYDMELLSQLPPADTLAASPSLLIFHMIGQHEDYAERFPAEYAHFTADSISNPYTDQAGRQIVADYDNATRYNDAVVCELLRRYADQDVVAIYLSDHGEEIYDWRNSCYRTNSDQMTPEIARYQYEIPLLFYVSDTYKHQHPDLVRDIQAAQHRPFIATMLPFVLFHLAGISQRDYRPELDLLSPQYDTHPKRIIREDVDYDQLMGKGN